jgi:hypothetical protein
VNFVIFHVILVLDLQKFNVPHALIFFIFLIILVSIIAHYHTLNKTLIIPVKLVVTIVLIVIIKMSVINVKPLSILPLIINVFLSVTLVSIQILETLNVNPVTQIALLAKVQPLMTVSLAILLNSIIK